MTSRGAQLFKYISELIVSQRTREIFLIVWYYPAGWGQCAERKKIFGDVCQHHAWSFWHFPVSSFDQWGLLTSLADGDCDGHNFSQELDCSHSVGKTEIFSTLNFQIEPSISNECLDCVTVTLSKRPEGAMYVLLIKVTKLARLNMTKMTYWKYACVSEGSKYKKIS